MISERLVKVFSGLFIVLFGLFLFIAYYDIPVLSGTEDVATEPEAEQVNYDAYGFEHGKYEVLDTLIRRRQTFSDLFKGFNTSTQTILAVAEESKRVMNVKRFRAGDRYRMYYETDSLQAKKARYLVYQKADKVHYLVYDLNKPYTVTEKAKEVKIFQKEIAGYINLTLYQALEAQGAHPDLAWHMADILAWKIDFYRIRRGDHFKIVYTEKYVDGEPVGIDKILGIRFNHMRNDYYAVHYANGEVDGYFDENGDNVRSAFLMAPVKYSRISSGYTLRRFHPVQKRYKAHLGTDYAAAHGQPILATGDGVVMEATRKQYNGKYVKIRHNSTYTTAYLHMSRIQRGMKPGTRVKQGDVIGYVGSTGLATGPHVCYRFWKNGKQVDPRREKLPTSQPIPEVERSAYRETLTTLLPRLHAEAELASR